MSKAVNRHQFLSGNPVRVGVIAQTLKTSVAAHIVEFADKQIELNELEDGFHTTILLV
jgi:hypothetical protein